MVKITTRDTQDKQLTQEQQEQSQQQEYDLYQDEGYDNITKEFLLRGYNKTKELIEEQKKVLIEDGTPPNVVNRYLTKEEDSQETNLKQFITRITNSKTKHSPESFVVRIAIYQYFICFPLILI